MRRNVFDDLISQRLFKELFISEMGWNKIQGNAELPPFIIGDTELHIYAIAQRNGFQVLTCEIQDIPTSSFCKQLDHKLRRQANDYILIFYTPQGLHHLWVAPVKKVDKRDLVFMEYLTLQQADFIYSKIDALSFEVDEQTTIMDVKERIGEAFIVNAEKITKNFYDGFRKEHQQFAKFISGIDDHIDTKNNKNKQWYTSIMLNRLMFCYFIQKKQFLDGNTNYLSDKLRWVQQEQGEDRFFQSFYRGFLTSLFHDGLNAPDHNDEFLRKYGRIPYLNGGMFDEHQLERDYADIDIADAAFESLFAFFDKWHWHLDDRHTASGKDINPDVLGYIFEQYINDRAAMGAYYTKEDITGYIGKNCIIPFLIDKVLGAQSSSSAAKIIRQALAAHPADTYLYDAVRHGYTPDWQTRIPQDIAQGIDTTQPDLLARRAQWNTPTPDTFGLPTEIWRETIERLQRCDNIISKIQSGEIGTINDFITYNLDIVQFTQDLLQDTNDHLFIRSFYKALQSVSILDPTCGSGAFLFAAMNILEPLYERCLDRMEEFNAQNDRLFADELADIRDHYRSNRPYFIYKSIILNNLYGVDIMAEATEIAKLRLFLKMVAVVERDPRQPNFGLDPLPDIDFNIRCGNTLVGYATEQQLSNSLKHAQDILEELANQELKEKVNVEMKKVADTFEIFKSSQLNPEIPLSEQKKAKKELRDRLTALNKLLNDRLRLSMLGDNANADEFMRNYQPFHWLAEFYQIIHDNGGFDVIIGNPPYVEFTQNDRVYGNLSYETLRAFNLHPLCVERSKQILRANGKFGMILPVGAFSTQNMKPLMNYLEKESILWLSFYHFRPARLFDGGKGASIPTTIFITQKSEKSCRYSTCVNKFTPETRYYLFDNLKYTLDKSDFRKSFDFCYPKLSNEIENSILEKVITNKTIATYRSNISTKQAISYRTAGGLYFKIVINFDFPYASTSNKTSYLREDVDKNVITSLLNSSLQWLICTVSFDTLNFKDYYIFNIPFTYENIDKKIKEKLIKLCDKLMQNYKTNAKHKYRGETPTYEITANLAKPIIDEIDKVLAEHYGFTEEELDFIINYDIKYRMGDNLNDE